jgi:polyhydroxyalkanoate synthesis regulator protein
MFSDFQSKMAEQAQGASPEAWNQFMRMQPPAMQNMMSSYMEQSQNMFTQMQEQMQKQTEQMLGALGIKRNS